MIVPFTLCFKPTEDMDLHVGIVENFLIHSAVKKGYPIISQQRHFDLIKKSGPFMALGTEEEAEQLKNYLLKADHQLEFGISDSFVNELINRYSSQKEAWDTILQSREEFLEQKIEEILLSIPNYQEIKAIFCYMKFPSLIHICEKYNIAFYNIELSPIRVRTYNQNLMYFQKESKFDLEHIKKRYDNFKKELETEQFNFLSRKELLALFLNKNDIEIITKLNNPPEYELGVALGSDGCYIERVNNFLNNDKTLQIATNIFDKDDILVRRHYIDMRKDETKYDAFNQDNDGKSADWILRSKRIMAVYSNVLYEAMLFNRSIYTLSHFSASLFSNISNNIVSEKISGVEDLNFIFINYFVPYELMFDIDFIKFKQQNPPEHQIHQRILDYYLEKNNISNEFCNKTGNFRFEFLLKELGYNDDEINKLKKSEYKNMEEQVNFLNNELGSLYNSKSWKITKPLRYIINLIKSR